MKKIYQLLSIFLIALLTASCGEKAPQLNKGLPTPSFELGMLNGGSINFPADFKDKVVVIRFWADWCPFCESEMQAIEPVYKHYKDKGLVILAINVRQDQKKAAAFVESMNISYDVVLDLEGDVARNYGVVGLPTTFVLSRDGKLHTRILGESTPEIFEQLLQEVM